MSKENAISITGVMIEDPSTKGYTAYFAEFPEIIAQGENIESAKDNLFSALKSMLDFKREEMKEEEDCDDNIITQSYALTVS